MVAPHEKSSASSSSRIPAIDVLRGVCLFGILVMNIQSFALPHQAYLNPLAWGSLNGLDGVAWAIGRIFFDFKFITLFSTLFGASLMLGGDTTRPQHRLYWLIAFGLVHSYLIWYGDILFTYGVVGLVVLGARSWSPRRLLSWSFPLLLLSPILVAVVGALYPVLPAELHRLIADHLSASGAQAEVAAFRGSWLTQLPTRASLAFEIQTTSLLTETGIRAAGAMLFGMAMVKLGTFEGKAFSSWSIVGFLLTLGVVTTAVGALIQAGAGFAAPRAFLLAQAIHELGSIGLAGGIGLLVIKLANRFPAASITALLATAGRAAFSVYISQSVIGTLLFGGHGLGLFGWVGRAELLALAVVMFAAQVAIAALWLRFFKLGPLEWLWRSLTRGSFDFAALLKPTSGTAHS